MPGPGESLAHGLGQILRVSPVGPGLGRSIVFGHGGIVELRRHRFEIQGTWDGKTLLENEFARIGLVVADRLDLDA